MGDNKGDVCLWDSASQHWAKDTDGEEDVSEDLEFFPSVYSQQKAKQQGCYLD